MIIKFDVDGDLYGKIEELVKNGKYQDIYQFIKIAITNQIQEEQSGSTSYSQPTVPFSIKFEQMKDQAMQKVLRTLSDIPLEESQLPPPIQDLIWSFYNRFFPVKIVVRTLATLVGPQNTWIELNKIQEESYALAQVISSKLKQIEEQSGFARNEKLSTGLPTPLSELEGARGFQRPKIESKILASKIRFIEQFVGKLTKKEPSYEFKGACFDMNLIGVKIEGKNCYVTLTENGKEFALMENPILDEDKYNDSFSSEEVSFIFNKILPRFKLENIIVKRILSELGNNELTSEQIDKIFEEEKSHYYDLKKPINKAEKVKLDATIVRERVAMMGRLSELRIVNWEVEAGKSKYSLNKLQTEF